MKYLVYGSRELGRVVRGLLDVCGLEFVGFIDDIHTGSDILGPFEQVVRTFRPDDYMLVNAVGYANLAVRKQISGRILSKGYSTPCIIHPAASIAPSAKIGVGSIIMAQAVIDFEAVLGEMVVLWPGAVVNHDARIGENTFLSPNCTICGGAVIGANSFVGAGAVVADHRTVPDDTFLKANSTWTER